MTLGHIYWIFEKRNEKISMLISFYFTFFQFLMIYIFIYWDLLYYMLFFNHNEKNFHLKFVFKKIQYSPVVSYHYYFFLLFKKNVYHDLLSFTVLLFMYLFVRYWMLGAGALGRPRGMVWGGRREEGSGWGTHVYLWWIHFDIWQNQYNIVKLKNKIKN